jgi:hypothetical protein
MSIRDTIAGLVGRFRRRSEPRPRPRPTPRERPTLEEGDADGRELKEATDRAREELRRVSRD